jgi:hypothetical protein
VTFDLESFTLKQALIYFINHKNAATALGRQQDALGGVPQGLRPHQREHVRFLQDLLPAGGRVAIGKQVGGLAPIAVQPAGGPALLLYLKEKRGVGNKTYNNYRGYFSIIFNFYISSQELPIKNPITKVEALTVEASELHLPFSNAQLSSIQETLLAKGDKQLLLFISFIYYTFARPAEEYACCRSRTSGRRPSSSLPSGPRTTRANTSPSTRTWKHSSRSTATQIPKDYYVFTADQKPGEVPAGVNYFYKRHKKLLEELGLADESYTLYGYKHTGPSTSTTPLRTCSPYSATADTVRPLRRRRTCVSTG